MISTIDVVITKYLDSIKLDRSEHTVRAYKNALNIFCNLLIKELKVPQNTPIDKLAESDILPFVEYLNNLAPATEKLYIQAVKGFYEYLNAEGFAEINILRLRNTIRQRARHSRTRIPELAITEIEQLLLMYTPSSLQQKKTKYFDLLGIVHFC